MDFDVQLEFDANKVSSRSLLKSLGVSLNKFSELLVLFGNMNFISNENYTIANQFDFRLVKSFEKYSGTVKRFPTFAIYIHISHFYDTECVQRRVRGKLRSDENKRIKVDFG